MRLSSSAELWLRCEAQRAMASLRPRVPPCHPSPPRPAHRAPILTHQPKGIVPMPSCPPFSCLNPRKAQARLVAQWSRAPRLPRPRVSGLAATAGRTLRRAGFALFPTRARPLHAPRDLSLDSGAAAYFRYAFHSALRPCGSRTYPRKRPLLLGGI